MTLLVSAAALALLALGVHHLRTPTCPTCQGRSWDRRMCRPLLLCRRCAERVPPQGLFG